MSLKEGGESPGVMQSLISSPPTNWRMMKNRIIAALGLSMLVTGLVTIVWSWGIGNNALGIFGVILAISGMITLTRRV